MKHFPVLFLYQKMTITSVNNEKKRHSPDFIINKTKGKETDDEMDKYI